MLVFGKKWKPEYPKKNLLEQSREPTNSVHTWRRVRRLNLGYIGWWKASVIAIVLLAGNSESLNNIEAKDYLTVMAEWAMSHEAEGRMGYWLRGHEGERNNCFSIIQVVGNKIIILVGDFSKTWFNRHCFVFQSQRFSLLVGYNI